MKTSAFDIMAETYDADFTTSVIGRLQRGRVWSLLDGLLAEKDGKLDILEINCGTGEDGLRLASLGHNVTATDASPAMIAKAKEKAGAADLKGVLNFEVCGFDQLSAQYPLHRFDLVFSNFGGLNCIDKKAMQQLRNDLSLLVKPNGTLFLVVMGKCCLWEILHFGMRGKFRQASRRINGPVPFVVKDTVMPVHYYSPGELKRLFAPLFRQKKKMPVGLFIPPSYLENKFIAKPGRLEKLAAREQRFSKSILAAYADHYCIILEKNPQS